MSKRNSAVTALLKRPIAFHPILARIVGSVPAGLMLSQAVYWTGVLEEKKSYRLGWFYKTQVEWTKETCLSRWEQESARRLLRKCEFWDEDLKGNPARLWFRVDLEKLASCISQYEETPHSSMREKVRSARGESANKFAKSPHTVPETTTETSTETKTETTSENLGRRAASLSYSSKSTKTPQQRRYASISRLAERAVDIIKSDPGISPGDLAENLKTWAAQQGIPYFDAWPGAASPIEQAITIAMERCA